MRHHHRLSHRPQPRPVRTRPGFDRLEGRLALSASGLLVHSAEVATLAADTAPVVHVVPNSIRVDFGRPLDRTSAYNDFRIAPVGADGSSPEEIEIAETLADDGETVDLTTSRPLAPGRYQLILRGDAGLATADGHPLAVRGEDRVLVEFSVEVEGLGTDDARPLVVPTGEIVSVGGSLDLASDPSALGLYRFELAPGHTYRVGLQVDAQRDGSPLNAALALFDASGRPIATNDVGRAGAPSDPALFAGLGPGVYYIGVSGSGNLPGLDGGYDLASSSPGEARPGLASGGFTLKVVADLADAPTRLKTFSLVYADPSDPTPTGLTLQFDGPISVESLKVDPAGAVTIVDRSGRSSTAFATGYDEARAAVTFTFARALPQGIYTVSLPSGGGLLDLAGRAPVAVGLKAGTLGVIIVGKKGIKLDPNDLGALTPGDALTGVSRSIVLAPGKSTTLRASITVPGFYEFQASSEGGKPTLTVRVDGKDLPLDAGQGGSPSRSRVWLDPGGISLKATGGEGGSRLTLSLRLTSSRFDALLDNGVGRSAALDLRLVSPESIAGGVSPSGSIDADGPVASGRSASGVTATPLASDSSAGSSARATASSSLASAAGLYVVAPAAPAGHPSAGLDAITVVGPVGPSGLASIASSSTDGALFAGLGRASRASSGRNVGAIEALRAPGRGEDAPLAETILTATNLPAEALATAEATGPAGPNAPGPVEQAIMTADSRRPAPEATALLGDDALLAEIDPQSPDGPASEPDRVEQPVELADLSGTFGLGVIALAAAHYHRRLAGWLRRSRSRIVARRQGGDGA